MLSAHGTVKLQTKHQSSFDLTFVGNCNLKCRPSMSMIYFKHTHIFFGFTEDKSEGSWDFVNRQKWQRETVNLIN
jgi:hypothetical protein